MVDVISTDVVVVGARCAGSSLAMCLARKGHRVVVVDRATFPSDMKLSTLLIWHAGVDLLQGWGLLEPLARAGTPLLTKFALDLGDLVLFGEPPGTVARAAIAPKRIVLDRVLAEAAVAAGADLREGVSFEGVLRDAGGRVAGIRCARADGSALEIHARCVVGADGRTSEVARAVGAAGYHEFRREQCTANMYAFYSGVEIDGALFFSRPERMAYAWNTNDAHAMIGVIVPGREARPPGEDIGARALAELEVIAPALAGRLRAATRETEWMRVSIPTGCRTPAGAGWALVGDAGLTFDPITAAGMTNAFRDAKCLADALDGALAGRGSVDDALADFAARRDASAVRWHLFAQQMAEFGPPTEEMSALFAALATNRREADRYFGLFGQTVLPADFFDPANVARLLAGARDAGLART